MKTETLKIAILLVNGMYDYKEKLWLEISVANIVKYISRDASYKIFIWNHNTENQRIAGFLQPFGNRVEVLDETNFDIAGYDPEHRFRLPYKNATFAGGLHVHSTPLQILYEYAVARYEIDTVITFDNDACPVRHNWDLPLIHALEHGKLITGIWRDELIQVIRPYVHPSCLAIKNQTIEAMGFRFNELPVYGKLDTLAHFTYAIQEKYGNEVVAGIKRNNRHQFHPVFNGIYGSMFYHHHFGTRNQRGKSKTLKSYGWKERNENMTDNRLVMDGTTEMLFTAERDFFDFLIYGADALRYRIYLKYLDSDYSRYRAYRLFHYAVKAFDHDPLESFYILTLIMPELREEKRFIEMYIRVCDQVGLAGEAEAYRVFLHGGMV